MEESYPQPPYLNHKLYKPKKERKRLHESNIKSFWAIQLNQNPFEVFEASNFTGERLSCQSRKSFLHHFSEHIDPALTQTPVWSMCKWQWAHWATGPLGPLDPPAIQQLYNIRWIQEEKTVEEKTVDPDELSTTNTKLLNNYFWQMVISWLMIIGLAFLSFTAWFRQVTKWLPPWVWPIGAIAYSFPGFARRFLHCGIVPSVISHSCAQVGGSFETWP